MVTLEKQDFQENKRLYDEVEKKLRMKLGQEIPITLVGSTAIPDMCGKNIIDILIGAKDTEQFEYIYNVLEEYEFVASKKSKDEIYQFFSSTASETGSGDVHIHLVIIETERYSEFIILKEFLLKNREEALNYSNFKKEIINKGITDRKEYKAIKSKYVTDMLARAKEWYSKL